MQHNISQFLADHVESLSIWIGMACTLGLYSILYKENKIYRLFEHIYLGLALGYIIATTWTDVLLPKWYEPMVNKGQWWLILYTMVGLLYYMIYSRKFAWMSRLVIGFFLGVMSGRAFQAFVNDVWPQIPGSFKPLIPHGTIHDAAGKVLSNELTTPDAINNVIFIVILLCVMSYFFFSFEQKHMILKGSAKWGRWLMMFTFGAIFGSTMMARLSLLIDRVDYLLNDFGPLIGGPAAMFLVLMGLAALVVFLVTRQAPSEEGPR